MLIYKHRQKGVIIKAEIRDETYRIIYRTKFNITDKEALLTHLQALESFSPFSIIQLLKEKLRIGDWI